MNYRIEKFDPKLASDEFWDTYFAFTNKLSKEQNPDDPLPNRQRVIKNQVTDFPDFQVTRWLVYTENDKIIGWAGGGFPTEDSSNYEKNKHIMNVNLSVDSDYRRKGIGSALLKLITEMGKENNKTLIEGGTDTKEGIAFCKALEGSIALEGAENRLKFSEIDWELMEQWIDTSKNKAQDVTIETFGEVSDDDIDEYVDFYTELLNQVPLGELEGRANITPEAHRKSEADTKERGFEWITKISREKDGKISGLTDIYYNPLEGHRVGQGLTGVKEDYRGRGLGKWLKAEMTLYIKEKYPKIKYISTGNANENVPMLAINKQMGFKFYKEESAIKFNIEELSKKLN